LEVIMIRTTVWAAAALASALLMAAAPAQAGEAALPDTVAAPVDPPETRPAETQAATGLDALTLTIDQREAIYRAIARERSMAESEVSERVVPGGGFAEQVAPEPGAAMAAQAKLPSIRRLGQLPERIVNELPAIRPYRYVIDGARVLLVDPDSLLVVAEIGP
jgi:hypothetical protein